jgi:hypothetical protein
MAEQPELLDAGAVSPVMDPAAALDRRSPPRLALLFLVGGPEGLAAPGADRGRHFATMRSPRRSRTGAGSKPTR